MDKLVSVGKGWRCGEIITQRTMAAHFKKHLAQLEKEQSATGQSAFHLYVKAAEMFLHILVKGSATFKTLDTFLRAIWLECGGHLSECTQQNAKISFTKRLEQVLTPKMKLEHDYDFGSTTTVSIQVMGAYQLIMPEKIVLLSRNELLPIMCSSCNKQAATSICIIHIEEGEGFYCEDCAAAHAEECEDFADYANMPVVNSPVMGVCGYVGGTIDTERDGVYRAR
ncbi:hypothetical protein AHMF7605_19140 [Adhaeribacter arboris]|uniref:Uncharacterized protein n=1 Tax=Adhaeribacter arboris TaxID=2072846 RepID=A0A2T2YIZ4_9BACT|nr:hypothetical protein [Adhaeribacter arboris]PSR55470.1 hypothetical protein AHMF7605_19140 [Adhaeribacter arboris]